MSRSLLTIESLTTRGTYRVRQVTAGDHGYLVTVFGVPGWFICPVLVRRSDLVDVRGYEGEFFARHAVPSRGPA